MTCAQVPSTPIALSAPSGCCNPPPTGDVYYIFELTAIDFGSNNPGPSAISGQGNSLDWVETSLSNVGPDNRFMERSSATRAAAFITNAYLAGVDGAGSIGTLTYGWFTGTSYTSYTGVVHNAVTLRVDKVANGSFTDTVSLTKTSGLPSADWTCGYDFIKEAGSRTTSVGTMGGPCTTRVPSALWFTLAFNTNGAMTLS